MGQLRAANPESETNWRFGTQRMLRMFSIGDIDVYAMRVKLGIAAVESCRDGKGLVVIGWVCL